MDLTAAEARKITEENKPYSNFFNDVMRDILETAKEGKECVILNNDADWDFSDLIHLNELGYKITFEGMNLIIEW